MRVALKYIPDEDLPAFFEMLSDKSLTIQTGSIPLTIDIDWAHERLLMQRKGEVEGTRFDRGLYEGDTLVGMAGWFRNDDGLIEIGYAIHRDHRGKGYATKAASMVLDMLRESGCAGPVYAQYFQDNEASGSVLAKLGFKQVRSTEGVSAARIGSSPAWLMRLDFIKEGEQA